MTFFSAFSSLLSDDPTLRMLQGGLLLAAVIVIFLLFFATRDILLRTRSFLYQFFCILLVALLPGIGFLLYLLIRPARTIKQREEETMLLEILHILDPEAYPTADEVEAEESQEEEEKEEKHAHHGKHRKKK